MLSGSCLKWHQEHIVSSSLWSICGLGISDVEVIIDKQPGSFRGPAFSGITIFFRSCLFTSFHENVQRGQGSSLKIQTLSQKNAERRKVRAKGQRLSKNVFLYFFCFLSREESLPVTTFRESGPSLVRSRRETLQSMGTSFFLLLKTKLLGWSRVGACTFKWVTLHFTEVHERIAWCKVAAPGRRLLTASCSLVWLWIWLHFSWPESPGSGSISDCPWLAALSWRQGAALGLWWEAAGAFAMVRSRLSMNICCLT